jgi:quercetin dioxygenase-like cupin family protein
MLGNYMEFPFEQLQKDGKIIRTFQIDVDSEELKWHQDLKDRRVKIIESGNWQFQLEDQLPNKLHVGQELFIEKFVWHRVIKGDSKLVVEIVELN